MLISLKNNSKMFKIFYGFPQYTNRQAIAVGTMFLKTASQALKKRLMNLYVLAKKAGLIGVSHQLWDFITELFCSYIYTSVHEKRTQSIQRRLRPNCSGPTNKQCSCCEQYNQNLLQSSHRVALSEVEKILANPMILEDLFRKNSTLAVNHAWKSFRAEMISKQFESWKSLEVPPGIKTESLSSIQVVDLRIMPDNGFIDPDSGACYF
jgi:hypothetical protein